MNIILKQVSVVFLGFMLVLTLIGIIFLWFYLEFNIVLKSIFCFIPMVILIVGGGLSFSYFWNKYFLSDEEFIDPYLNDD